MSRRGPLLLAPLRYWSIRHPAKRSWDVGLPLLGSAALTSLILFWPAVQSPFAQNGFLASLQSLFAILGGFFVSALTLISTSSSDALKQPLSGSPKIRFAGEAEPMTRQRFLSMLFGYLAFSAFALFAVGFLAVQMAPGAKSLVSDGAHLWIKAAFFLPYNFWLCHLFVATLVGLYYFTDRLVRTDPVITRRRVHPVEPERQPERERA